MSTFTRPAVVEILDDFKFKLIEPFEFYLNDVVQHQEHLFKVNKGFITDLASTPRFLWSIIPPHGRYAKAAILHDFLLEQGSLDRAFVDYIFLQAMLVLNVPPFKARLMYNGVRIWSRYQAYKGCA